MTGKQETIAIEMISVDQIAVINPRIRNRKIFRQIVDRDPISAGSVGEAAGGGGSMARWGCRRTRSVPTRPTVIWPAAGITDGR